MLFNPVLVYGFLLASTVIAVPPLGHSQHQLPRVERSISTAHTNTTEYAGATLQSFPSGTFDHVNASFVVPTLNGPHRSNGYAYVGIDGVTCAHVMLRSGIEFQVTKQGPQYQAWVQWYPNGRQDVDLGLAPGDQIHIDLVAMTPSNGLATIRNSRNGEEKLYFVGSATPLCMSDAGWYVQKTNDSLSNFGEIVFEGATGAGGGKEYTPEKAHLYDIKAGNKVLSTTSVRGTTVTVKYE